jgi:DNA ligase (NAD+)
VKERLAHFCSRDAMDIEGVGPALIEQLVDKGLVRDASDLYKLTKDQLLTLEGVADKSSENVLHAIAATRDRDFERVVFALGIRHVGWTTARALSDAFGSMDKLSGASLEDLSRVEGIGAIVGGAVRQFFDNTKNRELVDSLEKIGLRMRANARAKGPFEGKVFLFTGELESIGRDEAGKLVEQLGGRVGETVTKTTDYVVVGANPGSKLAKAKSMNKKLLGEQEFLRMVRNA